ncbi:hypothetical protein [Nitrosopumilus sp.]|uniref:hypothetical protein n=1 Tax=Nitrosopumilus sp. TaxID=2024843 RepID=UPI002613A5A7|nr:hypothetical protein [Nitrosopumilus sp.]
MRLGTRSPNEFMQLLNSKNEEIQSTFLNKIKDLTDTVSVKVMMGDSTVTEQKTFDPKKISDFFQKINQNLDGWSIQDVSISNNEDIRRIFAKFEIMEGNYLVSGHVSIQFHVLLYYKPDQRVIDCQKELAEIVDLTKNQEQQLSDNSDEFVLQKLKDMGYKDFDHQKLFEIFYENDEFREKIFAEIEKTEGVDFQKLSETKTKLFNELDSLLVETYQITPVLIDDSKLVTGEEGCLCTFDLEFIKDNNREGLFDAKKMSDKVKENIIQKLDNFHQIIKS